MRKLLISILFRWSAWQSDTRLARLLNRFALVEADSAWQMLQAMEEVKDPEYRAELFNNALEEVHHAWLFKQQSNKYAQQPFVDAQNKRKRILGKNGDLLNFKVEHYLGEKDVYEQFLTYAPAVPHEEDRELFLEIRGDEEEHQRKARIKLLEELGSKAALQKKIIGQRLKKLYRGWIALGKGMGNLIFGVFLFLIYLIGGIFFKYYCKKSLGDPKLATRIATIEVEKQQSNHQSQLA